MFELQQYQLLNISTLPIAVSSIKSSGICGRSLGCIGTLKHDAPRTTKLNAASSPNILSMLFSLRVSLVLRVKYLNTDDSNTMATLENRWSLPVFCGVTINVDKICECFVNMRSNKKGDESIQVWLFKMCLQIEDKSSKLYFLNKRWMFKHCWLTNTLSKLQTFIFLAAMSSSSSDHVPPSVR